MCAPSASAFRAGRRKSGDVLSGGYVNLAREPLSERLRSVAGRPLAVDNDATMALAAEARIGAGHGARDIALVAIGTGIGGAALNDARQASACAGQFGHITVDYQGAPCACGRRGSSKPRRPARRWRGSPRGWIRRRDDGGGAAGRR